MNTLLLGIRRGLMVTLTEIEKYLIAVGELTHRNKSRKHDLIEVVDKTGESDVKPL